MRLMNVVGSPAEQSKLQDAIAHAEALDRKAERTGDAQDFVAASTAYGNAAYLAHSIGIGDRPKDERDRGYQLGVSLNKLSNERKKRSEEIIRAGYTAKREKWSERETLTSSGAPPARINVLDQHGGFTAVTKPPWSRTDERPKFASDPKAWLRGDTLWRPGNVLKGTTQGELAVYDDKSFFQTNNDVTIALYRVPGYQYPVAVWFDNKTGKRIA